MRPPLAHRRNSLSVMTAMTPMIDVVFNLLIFFVVSISSGALESLLPADLSSSGNVASAAASPTTPKPDSRVEIWLKVFQNESEQTVVDMNGTPYVERPPLKAALLMLGELDPANPVILQIAPEVPLESLIDVYDTCQQAGFQSVNFAAGARE